MNDTMAMLPSTTAPRCLLCSKENCRPLVELTSKELIELWAEFGVSFSGESVAMLESRRMVPLHECQGCGFRFFDPDLAGPSAFYEDLQRQSGAYYAPFRTEFQWALDVATREGLLSVLDAGCGTGAFLDLARGRGLKTHGLELNPTAAESCRQKGHAVFSGSLADYSRGFPEARFDLVTAFQVVEHVPDPVMFLREAAALARPGGGVVIGVPNELGIERICPWDPHQWPPHHISRWRPQDLRELGRRAGLSVAATGMDRMHGNDLYHFWTLHNKLAVALGRKPYRGGKLLPKCISWVYRKTGSKYFLPRFGPNIYAFYRRDTRN